jgi:hypothetical protein
VALWFWGDDCQPALIQDDDWTTLRFISEEELKKWNGDPHPIVFGGYELVMEDGSNLSSSGEGSGEEELIEMCASWCNSIEAPMISEETMRLLRESGREEGLDTTSILSKDLQDVRHSGTLGPVDCPFLRGYGDDLNIESTRSEKSGSKDWNLLGLRGT